MPGTPAISMATAFAKAMSAYNQNTNIIIATELRKTPIYRQVTTTLRLFFPLNLFKKEIL